MITELKLSLSGKICLQPITAFLCGIVVLIALAASLLLPTDSNIICYICHAVIIISVLLLIYTCNILQQKLIGQKAEIMHLQTQLAQSNRVKDDFLRNMSHELRTPLHAIIGLAELLMETNLNAAQAKMLEMIQISGQQLLRLVGDMLDLAQMEAQACQAINGTTAMPAL